MHTPPAPPSSLPPRLTEQALLDYLTKAIEHYTRAASRGYVQHFLEIAGQVVEVQIAGDTLAPLLTPALMHRVIPTPQRAPDLTIRAFDTASTGIEMPRPIWSESAYTSRTGLLAGVSNARVLAAFDMGSGIFNLLDTTSGQGIYWIQNGAAHPQYEMSTPFRVQFYWWLRTKGRYLVHGGAICQPNDNVQRGLLLVGKGGSGKSTSALSCLAAGWHYVADDYVIFGVEPEPMAYNLYQSAKVTAEHFANHFSHMADAIRSYTKPVHEKTLLMIESAFPGRIAAQTPIAAVVFPRLAAVPSPRLQPIAPQSTFTGLAATTLQKLPGATPHDVKMMMALVKQRPNYALEIGGDPRQLPPLLARLLECEF